MEFQGRERSPVPVPITSLCAIFIMILYYFSIGYFKARTSILFDFLENDISDLINFGKRPFGFDHFWEMTFRI